MKRVSKDFDNDGLVGHLVYADGNFFFISNLPPIPVPRGSNLLCYLDTKDVIELNANVPVREFQISQPSLSTKKVNYDCEYQ